MDFDFDEDALEKMMLDAVRGPAKASTMPSVLDYLRRRTRLPITFVPREIKLPKVKRRSKRYPFLEVEV